MKHHPLPSSFSMGDQVEIYGLPTTHKYNGLQGVVVKHFKDQERYAIGLSDASEIIHVKPRNLRMIVTTTSHHRRSKEKEDSNDTITSASATTATAWSCPECTLINSSFNLCCQVCKHQNQMEAPLSSLETSKTNQEIPIAQVIPNSTIMPANDVIHHQDEESNRPGVNNLGYHNDNNNEPRDTFSDHSRQQDESRRTNKGCCCDTALGIVELFCYCLFAIASGGS